MLLDLPWREQLLHCGRHERCEILYEHLIVEELDLPPEEHWELVIETWSMAEYQSTSSFFASWIEILEWQKPIDKYLKGIPDGEFKVYRGGVPWGLSWTLDKEKAEWFLKRKLEDDPSELLSEKTVSKSSDVKFYDNSREEHEVVIVTDYVRENFTM